MSSVSAFTVWGVQFIAPLCEKEAAFPSVSMEQLPQLRLHTSGALTAQSNTWWEMPERGRHRLSSNWDASVMLPPCWQQHFQTQGSSKPWAEQLQQALGGVSRALWWSWAVWVQVWPQGLVPLEVREALSAQEPPVRGKQRGLCLWASTRLVWTTGSSQHG